MLAAAAYVFNLFIVLPEILAGDWSKAMHKLHSQKATS